MRQSPSSTPGMAGFEDSAQLGLGSRRWVWEGSASILLCKPCMDTLHAFIALFCCLVGKTWLSRVLDGPCL